MKLFNEVIYRCFRAPWEKFVPFYDIPFQLGEIEKRFGPYFEIERIAGQIDYSKFPPGYAAYLMTRKGDAR